MKLVVKYPELFEKLGVVFSTIIRLILNVLLIILLIALVVGVYKSGHDLVSSLGEPLETLLQRMLLDVVFILALVEISITVLGYLKDGSVHVRYIVDTILIIMLNEVVSLWFKHPDLQTAIGLSILLLSLGAIRVLVTRFSPKHPEVK